MRTEGPPQALSTSLDAAPSALNDGSTSAAQLAKPAVLDIVARPGMLGTQTSAAGAEAQANLSTANTAPAPQAPLGEARSLQPAPTQAAPSPAPAEPALQLARAISLGSERSVEVRLDPPHLGRVRIEFDFTGDQVRAVVTAAEPEALNHLRRGAQILMRELASLGHTDVSLDFAEGGFDARQGADDRQTARPLLTLLPAQAASPVVAPSAYHRGDSLDLIL